MVSGGVTLVRAKRSILCELVSEAQRMKALGYPYLDPNANFRFPRTIALTRGDQIPVSERTDELIGELAHQLRENNKALRTSFSRNDWRAHVRRWFGDILEGLDYEESAERKIEIVQERLQKHIAALEGGGYEARHFFPCSGIGVAVPSIKLGPATAYSDGSWKSGLNTGSGYLDENDEGLRQLSKADWVIAVETRGFSREFSELRASLIARLLVVAIAMLWRDTPGALRAIELAEHKLPDVRVSYHQPLSAQHLNISYTRRTIPIPVITENEWLEISKSWQARWAKLEQLFEQVANNTDTDASEMHGLLSALIWFDSGCRERDHLMAVAAFGNALDALAGGTGNTRKIEEFFATSLSTPPDTIITQSGVTLRTAIRRIYSEGRSQFSHGLTDEALADWSLVRSWSETLCSLALTSALD